MTWQDFYYQNLHSVDNADSVADEYPQDPDTIEYEEVSGDEDIQIRDPGMALARLPPAGGRPHESLGFRVIDQARVWSSLESIGLDEGSIMQFLRNYISEIDRYQVE